VNPDRYQIKDKARRDERKQQSHGAFSRGDHVTGQRCRASAAVLCRPVGFALDVDYSPNDAFRVAQVTWKHRKLLLAPSL
jgi:hypothetical protein